MNRKLIAGIVVVVAVIGAYMFFRPEGDSETDKAAAGAADCLARYPVPIEAPAFVRRLRGCGDAVALEYTQLANPLQDTNVASTRLMLRIHLPATESVVLFGGRQETITACYRAEFNYYGLVEGDPDRVGCPKDAVPVTPPEAQRLGLPDNIGQAAEQVLRDLPTAPKEEVLGALKAKLPPALLMPPTLDVATRGGVTVIAAGSMERGVIDCRLAVQRPDGSVKAWAPDYSKGHASEMTCDTERAFRTYEAEAK